MQKNQVLRTLKRKKFQLNTPSGFRYLNADDLMQLIGVSESHAYRIIKTGKMSPQLLELLEMKAFLAIPDWPGWRFERGRLIDPDGYFYEEQDLETVKQMRHMGFKIGA